MKLWSKQSEIKHEPIKTAVNVPELWLNHNLLNFLSSTPKPKLEKQSCDYFFFAYGSQYIVYNPYAHHPNLKLGIIRKLMVQSITK